MIEAFVGLGSNLGDRLGYLRSAAQFLACEPAFRLRSVSHAYETEPKGPPQPHFLNAVAQVATLLSARATLQKLIEIEQALGRLRREKWGPREIDLDLLLYGGEALREELLEVPHPRMHERAFVLAPLAEIAPKALHPGLRLSAEDLFLSLPQKERESVRPFAPLHEIVG